MILPRKSLNKSELKEIKEYAKSTSRISKNARNCLLLVEEIERLNRHIESLKMNIRL